MSNEKNFVIDITELQNAFAEAQEAKKEYESIIRANQKRTPHRIWPTPLASFAPHDRKRMKNLDGKWSPIWDLMKRVIAKEN